MQLAGTLRVTRRFSVLSVLGLLGALLFLPSIVASAIPRPSVAQLLLFTSIVTAICVFSSWVGLRCADSVSLPMPYLRRLDKGAEPSRKYGWPIAVSFGLVSAFGIIAVLRSLRLPNLAGPLWSRIVSVFFAAGSLELVVHLLIMSVVVRVARGRRWIGIVAAAVFFVLFHASGLFGYSVAVIVVALLMNGIFALGLGVIYARYGFEYVLVCHAIAHVLAVSFA